MTNTSYIIPTGGHEVFFAGTGQDGPNQRYLNHHNNVNHNNNSIGHKYVNKFGDIIRTGDPPMAQRPNQRRVRHFSQQQSPVDNKNNRINGSLNGSRQPTRLSLPSAQDLHIKNGLAGDKMKTPDIDGKSDLSLPLASASEPAL